MLLSAVTVLVVAQSGSEVPEGLMNNPVCVPLASQAIPQTLCIAMCTIYLHIHCHMPSSNCSSAVVIRLTAKKYFARPPCFIQNHAHRNCGSRITSSRVRRLAITHCGKFKVWCSGGHQKHNGHFTFRENVTWL